MSSPTEQSDALALILGAGGAAIAALTSLVTAIALAKLKSLTGDVKNLADTANRIFIEHTKVAGTVGVHDEAIRGLQTKTLTTQLFEAATLAQNEKLRRIEDDVKATSSKVDTISTGLIARSGYSTSEMPAAKQPYRPLPR